MRPQTGEKIRVLIVDDIAETRENLRKLLSFDADIQVVGVASSGLEGIEQVKQFQPHVVLMDINMPGMDGITATEVILQESPAAQVVILSVQGETDYLRRAMLAGARDFLTKPPSGDELMSTVRRVYEMGKTRAVVTPGQPSATTAVLAEAQGKRCDGKVIAVFSPKGGVGCTTIAVNLAVVLQSMIGGGQKVALMDTNFQFGDVDVMLNLQASRSIADLVPQIEGLDSDMLSSVLTPHGSGIKVLLAPPHPEAAEGLLFGTSSDEGMGSNSTLGAVLGLMREEFNIIVVDVWSWIDDVALTVFDAAALIVLVVEPNIPAIKGARLFLEVAAKINYPMEKIALVVNSVDRRTGIRVEQIERAMIPVVAQIPLDERLAMTAANRGIPFVMRDQNRPISQGILRLAEYVWDELSESEEGEEERAEEPAVTERMEETSLRRLRHVFER
ncbi:MAG: response regulator [Chloroflexota bacterium]|nr:response regulator [Chloroflexota bacterium]